MPKGVYERTEKYREMMRRIKKGQSPNHKLDCLCPYCKTKRGELTGKNNPMYGKRSPNWKGGNPDYWRKLSRKIWEEYHDRKIPPGHIIHHKDENFRNIDPENLDLMESLSIHTRYHHQGMKCSITTKKKISEANKGKIPWNKGKHNLGRSKCLLK